MELIGRYQTFDKKLIRLLDPTVKMGSRVPEILLNFTRFCHIKFYSQLLYDVFYEGSYFQGKRFLIVSK